MNKLEDTEMKANIIRIIKGSITAIVITAVSILIGSSISTLKIKKMGLVNGALVGLIYILTIYVISSITGLGFALQLQTIIMMLAAIGAGMIGGIIGVNLK